MYSFNCVVAFDLNNFNPRCRLLFTVATGATTVAAISSGDKSSWYRNTSAARCASGNVESNCSSLALIGDDRSSAGAP
jgi:hypothetical protein